MADLFDLSNIDDLPAELKQDLQCTRNKTLKVLAIFKQAKKPIGLDAVLVAMYRIHKESLKRNQVNQLVYKLQKRKELRKVNKTKWVIK